MLRIAGIAREPPRRKMSSFVLRTASLARILFKVQSLAQMRQNWNAEYKWPIATRSIARDRGQDGGDIERRCKLETLE